MKRLFLTVFLLFSLSSCAGLPGKTYIIIQELDRVAEFGKLKYVVEKGDILEVTERKTCKGGFGTCFEVRNVATNEYGYVKKSRMEKRHLIFTEPGETDTTTKTPRVEKINKVESMEKTLKSAKFYTNLGNTYLKQEQYVKAASEYTKAIDINNNIAIAFVNRGIAYNMQGKNSKACSDWNRACELGECNMVDIAKKNGTCPE